MKKIPILALVVALIFGMKSLALAAAAEKSEDRWLIYWYISGNNLESAPLDGEEPAATADLQEIANKKFDIAANDATGERFELPRAIENDVKLSPNVKILIQTGGCKDWFISEIPHGTIGRYIFDSDGFHYQGALKDADMGDSKTLEDFLRYGKNVVEKDFKPTHRMFIFWNHGGLVGICYDERYGHKTITDSESFLDLDDIRRAFSKVFKASPKKPPFDIIGFDACIRATYDNANNIYGLARYMIASEETESQYGWDYSDWIKELSKNPAISAKNLSQLICQSSYDFLKNGNLFASEATFSVVDLSPEKWLPLRKAYSSFYKNYFDAVSKNPYIYSTLDAAALNDAEHYAEEIDDFGLLKTPGLMLDLKGLAEGTKSRMLYDLDSPTRNLLTQSADDLISAIDSAVAFNISGETRAGSNGISVYYPLSKDAEEFKLYASQEAAFKYAKALYGNLIPDSETAQNLRSTRFGKKSSAQNLDEIFNLSELDDHEIQIDEETNEVSVELSREQMKKVSLVSSTVVGYLVDYDAIFDAILEYEYEIPESPEEIEELLLFGMSANVKTEFEGDTCRLTDNFKATWPRLNNHLIFTFIMDSRNDQLDGNGNVIKKGYVIYGVPVIVNDSVCILRVAYYTSEQRYQIIGARPSGNKGVGRASRGFIELKKGDTVKTLLPLVILSNEDTFAPEITVGSFKSGSMQGFFKWVPAETFILDEDPVISDQPLEDGYYAYSFRFHSPRGGEVSSNAAVFDVGDGEIIDVEKIEDFDDAEDLDDENEPVRYKFGDEELEYDPATGEMVKVEK